jgi:hypothetical protein
MLKAHQTTEKAKATKKLHASNNTAKEYRAGYVACGKAKIATDKYSRSEKGQTTMKAWRHSAAGISKQARSDAAKAELYRTDANFRAQRKVHVLGSKLLKDRSATSPTFLKRTGWKSEKAFRVHMKSTWSDGMSWNNYGTAWEIDHKIPQEAYNFIDKADAKRCWRPNNIWALPPLENSKKNTTLDIQLCMSVGASCFPVSWEGNLPERV